MARFLPFEEVASREPTPERDLLWLAGQTAQLQAFVDGSAVLHGSVAWGNPTWRSDIDVALFQKEKAPDLKIAIDAILDEYERSTKGRYVIPGVDIAIIGTESEQSVTRANLVTGSAPITEKQTVREYVDATRLRLADHIAALAAMKGDPWATFQASYFAGMELGQKARRTAIRTYVSSVVETWRQQPLRGVAEGDVLEPRQLDLLAHAENFPIHLMRQVAGQREVYPKPDRAADVQHTFGAFDDAVLRRLGTTLEPFLDISAEYATIIKASRTGTGRRKPKMYYQRLRDMADALPFGGVEEIVWEYLDA